MEQIHNPVLKEKIRALLELKRGDIAIDATLDGGGHAAMLLEEISPQGCVIGIEQDSAMVKFIERRISAEGDMWKSLSVHHGNFRDIATIAKEHRAAPAQAILFDLGMSRWHFTGSQRGFSFQNPDEPLSMALEDKTETKRAAAELLNYASREELVNILFQYGEERRSRKIADAIIERRKKRYFYTVGDLLEVVEPIVGKAFRGKHPATKIFQALRIAVNDELVSIVQGLAGAWSVVALHGRIAVISYHSLEDRITKNFFKDCVSQGVGRLLNKKPIVPERAEIMQNPSARSAKLRVIEKISITE